MNALVPPKESRSSQTSQTETSARGKCRTRRSTLDHQLVLLGVTPLDPETVKREKAALLEKRRGELGVRGITRNQYCAHYIPFAIAYLGLWSFIAAGLSVIAAIGCIGNFGSAGLGMFVSTGEYLLLFATAMAASFCVYTPAPYWAEVLWTRFSDPFFGSEDDAPPPAAITELAGELAARLPRTRLTVEYLAESEDPYLVAHYKGEKRYLARWG